MQALSDWIQPQHLAEERLASYRDTFQQHPAKVLVLEDFLAEPMAKKLATFLLTEARFRREYGLASVEGAVEEDLWLAAPEEDRFFRMNRLAEIPAELQFSPNVLAYLRFRQTFQRDEYRRFFEALSGLELSASDDFGVHRMEVGDYLRAHSDDNRDRRIALVIYLTPGWESEYGGSLHLTDRSGQETVVNPTYNSMVVFDVLAETEHFVEEVRPDAGDNARLTIGGWYHRPERPISPT
jgi:hypothetical protein